MNNSIDFLTQKQVTERFPFISEITLWRARRSGKLPFYRIAGKVLYKLRDLEDYFETRRNNAAQQMHSA